MYNIYKKHFSWYFLAYGQVSNLRWKTKKLLIIQGFNFLTSGNNRSMASILSSVCYILKVQN